MTTRDGSPSSLCLSNLPALRREAEQFERQWLDALKREELLRAEVTRLQGLEQRNQATLQSYLERAEVAEAELAKVKAEHG